MMRPVILSSPENTAVGFPIFCADGVKVSPFCCGGLGAPGGRVACCGRVPGPGGAAPGGGGNVSRCTPGGWRAPGGYWSGYCSGYCPGYWRPYCCDGGGPGGSRVDGGY